MSKQVDNNIKEYIDKSGYRTNFLADQMGCHPSDISHYISGDRLPNRERLSKLCSILKTSPTIKKCNLKDLYPGIRFTREATYDEWLLVLEKVKP